MFRTRTYMPPTLFATAALCFSFAPLLADQCPAQNPIATIEALTPGSAYQGNTCLGSQNKLESYIGPRCYNPTSTYSGPEDIYKVVLRQGNNIGFQLEMLNKADLSRSDLAIALVRCVNGNSCFRSPKEKVGAASEEIEKFQYDPGIYYLYIDSRKAADCGPYLLRVNGINPTPDLNLDIVPDSPAIAGAEFSYSLSISNLGTLEAHNVSIKHTLPAGVTFVSRDSRCSKPDKDNTIICGFASLAVGLKNKESRKVTVHVKPDYRNSLILAAAATLDEGDPTPEKAGPNPNIISKTQEVKTQINLYFTNNFPKTINAGDSTTYILALNNAGLSDATNIWVEVDLSPDMSCSKQTPGCVGGKKIVYAIDRIPAGLYKPQSVTVTTRPSAFNRILHIASVKKAAELKPKTTVSAEISTTAKRVANLAISMESPGSVSRPAGDPDPLSYKIVVTNNGPSDSVGATLTDSLPAGMKFVSVPLNCKATGDKQSVTCDIGYLQAGQSMPMPITLKASIESWVKPGSLVNRATVKARDNAKDPVITSDPVETKVFVRAEMQAQVLKADRLYWTQPATSGGVKAGENLYYVVSAVNINGPSDFHGGSLKDKLPDGLSFVSSLDGCSATGGIVDCPVPALKQGQAPVLRSFVVRIEPWESGLINHNICIESSSRGHELLGDICADASTKVETAADLSVRLNSSPSAVESGKKVQYSFDVLNEGPSNASGVILELADVSIEVGDLAANTVQSQTIETTVPNEIGVFAPTAHVDSDTLDPVQKNNAIQVLTTVADDGDVDLAVSLSVDDEAAVADGLLTYKLTLTNQGFSTSEETHVSLSFSQKVTGLSPDCCKFAALGRNALETQTLTVKLDAEASGILRATASTGVPANDPNPKNNEASLELPVVQNSKGSELCANWSVRFFRGNAGTNTDLLFFVPNPPAGVVATGRAFTEKGDFLQTVSVSSGEENFQRPTLLLLAGAGSIEWTLQEGLVGSISSAHKRNGSEVQIPGFCRRPGHIGAKTLILRFFQVDSVANTYVAIRNETEEEVEVRITYLSESAATEEQTWHVAGHAVQTLDLQKELESLFGKFESWAGSLEIEAFRISDGEPVEAISGDSIRVGPGGLSGDVLQPKTD